MGKYDLDVKKAECKKPGNKTSVKDKKEIREAGWEDLGIDWNKPTSNKLGRIAATFTLCDVCIVREDCDSYGKNLRMTGTYGGNYYRNGTVHLKAQAAAEALKQAWANEQETTDAIVAKEEVETLIEQ